MFIMKIMFLVNLPSPYRVQFFSELGKFCDLTVVYERKSASDRNPEWNTKSDNTFKEIYLDGINIGNDNSLSLKILKYLNNDYDYIVIGMYSTLTAIISIIYMSLRKIPFIINSDGGFIKKESHRKYKLKKFLIGTASAWLSTGKLTNQYLIHYGAKERHIFIYPFSSIMKDDILSTLLTVNQKRQYKSKLNMREEKIILSVGQFIYRKGYDVLFDACDGLGNNIGIYIVGGKPNKEYLKLRKDKNLTNLHFVDFKKKSELVDYYKAADIFVLPTREDIWGLVVNEAMGYALPVITTDRCISGTELVSNGVNGFIVRTDSAEDLRKALILLSEKCDLKKFGLASLQTAQEYTIEKMVKRHLEIFDSLKNERGLSN